MPGLDLVALPRLSSSGLGVQVVQTNMGSCKALCPPFTYPSWFTSPRFGMNKFKEVSATDKLPSDQT